MSKAELEAELAKCMRSRGWYRGQYERLRDIDEIRVSEIDLLREQCIAYEQEIRRVHRQRTREDEKAEKDRKIRQVEIERRQTEARKRAEAAQDEPEDEDEARLFRCQRENARPRSRLESVERELAEFKPTDPSEAPDV